MKALITGASSGIGRDMARYMSSLGYDLILVARDVKKMEELKKDLKTSVKIISKDLSSKDNCVELYNETKEENIDILVNNAGFGTFGKFVETDLDTEINLINTNITAVHVLTKLYLKDMVKSNSGHILNVASIAGRMPGPLMAAYYASKNYVVRLSTSIAEELRRDRSNVKISVLCPGPVDTNFNNVAGVRFSLKGVPSEYVAKYGVDQMFKGKLMIFPTLTIKLLNFATRFGSEKMLMKIAYNSQKRKNGE